MLVVCGKHSQPVEEKSIQEHLLLLLVTEYCWVGKKVTIKQDTFHGAAMHIPPSEHCVPSPEFTSKIVTNTSRQNSFPVEQTCDLKATRSLYVTKACTNQLDGNQCMRNVSLPSSHWRSQHAAVLSKAQDRMRNSEYQLHSDKLPLYISSTAVETHSPSVPFKSINEGPMRACNSMCVSSTGQAAN